MTNIFITKNKASRKLNMDEEMEEDKEESSKADITDQKHESIKGMLDSINVEANFKNLWRYYGSKLSYDNLDERFFLEEGITANALNMTPFARQGNANKLKDPKQAKREAELNNQISNPHLNSKRLLDFNSSNTQNEDKGITLSSQLKDIKFPSMIPSSPYSIRAFTPATPVSLALEMVNWLKLKAGNAKRSLKDSNFPPVMSKYFEY